MITHINTDSAFYGRHRYKEPDLILIDDWRVGVNGLNNIVN